MYFENRRWLVILRRGVRQTNIGDASGLNRWCPDDVVVMSWWSHSDGIVLCAEHIKSGNILRGTTYVVAAKWDRGCRRLLFSWSKRKNRKLSAKHRHILSIIADAWRAVREHQQTSKPSAIVSYRSVFDIFNLGVTYRRFKGESPKVLGDEIYQDEIVN